MEIIEWVELDMIITTTEIQEKFWDSFCEQLSHWYRGAVSVKWIDPEGLTYILAEDFSLSTLAFKRQNNRCSDLMTVEAELPDEQPLVHEIIEPFRMILRRNEESGRYNELEILAESGKTEITFTPGIDAELLEKFAE
jgi:hypothetical protein